MAETEGFHDFPSPPHSLYYHHGDLEQYFSESQSPNASTYDAISAGDGSLSSRYPSPGHEDAESAESTQPQPKPAAAKRKRENRYKNAPPAVLSRRRAQNRASQRAYRERKDQRIKDLEQMLSDARQRNDVLSQAYAALHAEYVALKTAQLAEHQGYPQHHHQQQQQQPQHQYDLSFAGAGSGGGGGGGGGGGNALSGVDGLDMDMFVYTADMTTGFSL